MHERVAHVHAARAARPLNPTPLPSNPGLFPLSRVVSKHADPCLCLRGLGKGQTGLAHLPSDRRAPVLEHHLRACPESALETSKCCASGNLQQLIKKLLMIPPEPRSPGPAGTPAI